MTYPWTKAEVQIIKAAYATDAGRAALHLIVERLSGLMGDPFDADPYVMARNVGRRTVGVDLMRAINLPIEKVAEEPHEPRSHRIITATERAERTAAGQSAGESGSTGR